MLEHLGHHRQQIPLIQNIQNTLNPVSPTEPAPRPTPGEAAVSAAKSFVETMRAAETTSISGMVGKADPQSVVTALASAEIAVQSAASIRDKVVESYQEILRMPI